MVRIQRQEKVAKYEGRKNLLWVEQLRDVLCVEQAGNKHGKPKARKSFRSISIIVTFLDEPKSAN